MKIHEFSKHLGIDTKDLLTLITRLGLSYRAAHQDISHSDAILIKEKLHIDQNIDPKSDSFKKRLSNLMTFGPHPVVAHKAFYGDLKKYGESVLGSQIPGTVDSSQIDDAINELTQSGKIQSFEEVEDFGRLPHGDSICFKLKEEMYLLVLFFGLCNENIIICGFGLPLEIKDRLSDLHNKELKSYIDDDGEKTWDFVDIEEEYPLPKTDEDTEEYLSYLLTPKSLFHWKVFKGASLSSTIDFNKLNHWEEWMTFHGKEQKEAIDIDYTGPAQLKGVPGSGKTCVIALRAQRLAKKYQEKILVATLVGQAQGQLSILLDKVCGPERSLIKVFTVSKVMQQIIENCGTGDLSKLFPNDEAIKSAQTKFNPTMTDLIQNSDSKLKSLNSSDLQKFIEEELDYIRGRFLPEEYEDYKNPEFPRTGRKLRLSASDRSLMIELVKKWVLVLQECKTFDHPGMAIRAFRFAKNASFDKNFSYRSVLIDEGQDLYHHQFSAIAEMFSPDGKKLTEVENGVFFVSDPTQSIFNGGIDFRKLNIRFTGRSKFFRTNYRNSKNIFNAAEQLVAGKDFSGLQPGDEQAMEKFTTIVLGPNGNPPIITEFPSIDQEACEISKNIRIKVERGDDPESIIVIGLTRRMRTKITEYLQRFDIPASDIKKGFKGKEGFVKISTIESSKGFEAFTVFLCGLSVRKGLDIDDGWLTKESQRIYVGMTRARDELNISYTSNHEFEPHPLLEKIRPACDFKIFVDEPPANFIE